MAVYLRCKCWQELDASSRRSSEMARDWRGLWPAWDCGRLMMTKVRGRATTHLAGEVQRRVAVGVARGGRRTEAQHEAHERSRGRRCLPARAQPRAAAPHRLRRARHVQRRPPLPHLRTNTTLGVRPQGALFSNYTEPHAALFTPRAAPTTTVRENT
jgi:hypothetical protein